MINIEALKIDLFCTNYSDLWFVVHNIAQLHILEILYYNIQIFSA